MGDLAPGLRADLVVLDTTADDPLNALLFSGTHGLVRDVMVGGRWVVKDAHHVSEESAAAAYDKVLKELL